MGAGAGTCATLATYPFDVCRTTFAARGIATTPPAPRRQPMPFSSLVEPCLKSPGSHHHPPVSTTPPRTIPEFVTQLYQQKGWIGFYAGAGPAVVQIIPYMGLNFAIYDALTAGDKGVALSAWAGSISGAVSKMMIYPMDTVKRRLQAQAFFSGQDVIHYDGLRDCVVKIFRDEGVVSFYRGMVPSVLKTTIATGLSFALFRSTKNALEVFHDRI